jgi:hypothetical protein
VLLELSDCSPAWPLDVPGGDVTSQRLTAAGVDLREG